MKRFYLIFAILLLSVTSIVAQVDDYSMYLRSAYEKVENKDYEGAERLYSIYKKMTGKTDSKLEALLDNAEKAESWKNSCYIIEIGDGTAYAIVNATLSKMPVTWENAQMKSGTCRVGGFTDWYTPSEEELMFILQDKNIAKRASGKNIWTSTKTTSQKGKKGSIFYEEENNYTALNEYGDEIIYKCIESWDRGFHKLFIYENTEFYSDKKEPKCSYIIIRKFNLQNN